MKFHTNFPASAAVLAVAGNSNLVYAGSGSTQWFWDNAGCRAMYSIQPASTEDFLSIIRNHVRLSQGLHGSHIDGLPYTNGAAHADWPTVCTQFPFVNHYVPPGQFNSVRNYIHGGLAASGGLYSPHWVWKGNTLSITQCNGQSSASDGWISEVH